MMYAMTSLGVALWMSYGILRGDVIIMVANAITLIFALIILTIKIQNTLKGEQAPPPISPNGI